MHSRDVAAPTRRTTRRTRPAALLACSLACSAALAACGGGGDTDAPETSRAPERAGEVWEVDRADDREAAAAALLAYVNGLHVMVLDDDAAFAGMTRLRAEPGAAGGRTLTLANGLAAELVPAGDALELRFSSGETIPLRRQAPRAPAPR